MIYTLKAVSVHHELPVSAPNRVVVNASGAPVLWRVNEEGFLRSSILNGTTMWFLQAPDGLVVPDHLLPLGQNYFLSKSPVSWYFLIMPFGKY